MRICVQLFVSLSMTRFNILDMPTCLVLGYNLYEINVFSVELQINLFRCSQTYDVYVN